MYGRTFLPGLSGDDLKWTNECPDTGVCPEGLLQVKILVTIFEATITYTIQAICNMINVYLFL